jgi:hypothetical protein
MSYGDTLNLIHSILGPGSPHAGCTLCQQALSLDPPRTRLAWGGVVAGQMPFELEQWDLSRVPYRRIEGHLLDASISQPDRRVRDVR